MSREQLIGLIESDAKFMDEREDITEYVRTLKAGEGLDEAAIRDGYQRFKAEKDAAETRRRRQQARPARRSRCRPSSTPSSQRMIFDGEQLTDLLAPLDLGWRARTREGTGPDGRPRPAAEEARRRPRHLRAQRVRAVRRTA